MKRIALFLAVGVLFSACGNEVTPPSPDPQIPILEEKDNINLKVFVPKGSVSRSTLTYAAEDASAGENHIDSLYINLFQNGALINNGSFGSSKWKVVDDSTVIVGYEVDNITAGTPLTAVVYANRKEPKTITGEIVDPNKTPAATNSDGSWVNSFFMSGPDQTGATLTRNATTGNYEGTVHIQRNVAKLRVNITKSADCMPSDLAIDYSNIKIQILKVPNKTELFTSANASSGATLIDYTARTGNDLRKSSSFSSTNGGQIDSIYLYENRRTSFTEGTNTTQIQITVPTTSSTGGAKTDTYTYSLNSSQTATPDYNIIRNYIYTFNLKIAGQGLAKNTTLNILPWDDVTVNGDINGTYLTLDRDKIAFDENGKAIVNFCTDAQAIYFDYSDFNDANTNNFGVNILSIYDPTNNITKIETPSAYWDPAREYDGMILLDQQHCGTFGFKLDASINPETFSDNGDICIIAGNIRKCLPVGVTSSNPLVSLEVIPANSTNLVAPYISGDITLKYGLTQPLKAIAHFDDGSTEDVTNSATWSYDGTADGQSSSAGTASVGNSSGDKGVVTLIKKGTSKITAAYTKYGTTKSGTANVKPQIYKAFVKEDYYMWDAPVGAYYSSSYPTNNYNNILAPATATRSCKDCPTKTEAEIYIGNGFNYSTNDGLIFTVGPDDTNGSKLYCTGLWVKKWENLDTSLSASYLTGAAVSNRPSDSNISKYFFLPSNGLFLNGKFFYPGSEGRYWLSTPGSIVTEANYLGFNSTSTGVIEHNGGRHFGFIPLNGDFINASFGTEGGGMTPVPIP